MKLITIEVKNSNAMKLLHDLELNNMLRIVEEPQMDSPALSGKEMSIQNFRRWIKNAENEDVITLTEAKEKWQQKRKQLQKLIK
jgi:hypothetical protein